MKRKIITVDENKCDGCGLCIPNCPEGALQIIDGKVRVVSEISCDGLGACLGHCPQDALKIEAREAAPYDEKKVMENIVKAGENTIKAHLKHLYDHQEQEYLKQALIFLEENNIIAPDYQSDKKNYHGGCPSSKIIDHRHQEQSLQNKNFLEVNLNSELRQWPIQLSLLNPHTSFFQKADLLLAADCVPFTYANFHQKFLKNKSLIIFCPKLDSNIEEYIEKLTELFRSNEINSVTIARMEVPCCAGMTRILDEALQRSNTKILVQEVIISLQGEIINP